MPNYQKRIVYLSNEQRQELFENGSITVGGQTIIYSDNDMYVTPQDEPVTDVQVNGASIVQNGVANVPIASGSTLGVIRKGVGLNLNAGGELYIGKPTDSALKSLSEIYTPVTLGTQHAATFYGLAKAAGDSTQSASSNAVGTYTDSAKAAIQNMLGVSPMLAPVEADSTADQAYAIGEIFSYNGKLYQATAAISQGGAIQPGTNCQEVNVATAVGELKSALNDKLDSPETAGTSGQVLTSDGQGGQSWETPSGGGDVTDVQVNGTSVLTSGVANIPIGNSSQAGVFKSQANDGNNTYGIAPYSSASPVLTIIAAISAHIKAGSQSFRPIVPARQHESTFYGLAKAAGDSTQSASSNAVGNYTETAKSAISKMLSAPVTVSGTTPSITAMAGVRYICGECATLDITVPASGIIDVVFESGSTATVLTVTPPTGMTMKWANGFDPTSLDANTVYEINIMDGCYGVVGSWT